MYHCFWIFFLLFFALSTTTTNWIKANPSLDLSIQQQQQQRYQQQQQQQQGSVVVAVGGGYSCRERNLCCSGRDSTCSIPLATTGGGNGDVNQNSFRTTSLIGNLIGATVVQQTTRGGGGGGNHQDNNGQQCYCDSACIALGDCCHDYKETCGVQDCIVSDWNQWSECNTTCGMGSMIRTRNIIAPAQNGGKECPDLSQRRACHGQHCQVKDDEKMLREMAIILQSSFSVTRNVDENKDIRRNLRLNYPKDPLKENVNEYCVLFQLTKSHKSCESLNGDLLNKLQEGSNVCVHCQEAAMRRHLGYRCYGHGTKNRSTRWSMFNFSGCHGRWIRLKEEPMVDGRCMCQQEVSNINGTINMVPMDPDFIFV